MATVRRYDAGEVRGFERTPLGGLRVPAAVARTGVLLYRTPDGREVREYVPAETLFAADSLASLRGAPVTDLHPPGLVTTDNWRDYSVGHAGDAPGREDGLLVVDLLVQDAAEVARVEARERVEVSCGYEAEVDATPGATPAGERYDQVQTARRYNHVALGPAGWGRAGPSVALRMDAAGHVVPAQENASMKTVTFRGKTYRTDAAEDMAALQKDMDAAAAAPAAGPAGAAADGSVEAVREALKQALMKIAALEAQLAATKGADAAEEAAEGDEEAVLDAKGAARLARAVTRRLALEDDARLVLDGKTELRALSDAAIKKAVVLKALPKLKLDAFDAKTLDGCFRATVEGAREVGARRDAAQRNDAALHDAVNGLPHDGADTREDADDPMVKARKRSEAAWEQPLTLSAHPAPQTTAR
jgi:hypothetical protein